MAMDDISFLTECLHYEPDTGKFFWKNRPPHHFSEGKYGADKVCKAWNKKYAGKEAFIHQNGRGYLAGSISGKNYSAHRVAYAIMTGQHPTWSIDHINGIPTDNRFCNLREATPAQQMMNFVKRKNHIRGVNRHKKKNKILYSSSIRVHLGYFPTEEEAAQAYENAAKKIHDREFYLPNGKRLV